VSSPSIAPRRIVQIASVESMSVPRKTVGGTEISLIPRAALALCDDHSLWILPLMPNMPWQRLPDVPQGDASVARSPEAAGAPTPVRSVP
jgi:hypothetical protein